MTDRQGPGREPDIIDEDAQHIYLGERWRPDIVLDPTARDGQVTVRYGDHTMTVTDLRHMAEQLTGIAARADQIQQENLAYETRRPPIGVHIQPSQATLDEAVEWRSFGFGRTAATAWSKLRFGPVEAAAWADERFTATEAHDWDMHKFNPAEARDLIRDHGITDPAEAGVFRDAEAQRAVDVDARLAATMILRGRLTGEQLAAMASEKGWQPAGGGSTLFYDRDSGHVTARSHKLVEGHRDSRVSLEDVAEREANRNQRGHQAVDRSLSVIERLSQRLASTDDPELQL